MTRPVVLAVVILACGCSACGTETALAGDGTIADDSGAGPDPSIDTGWDTGTDPVFDVVLPEDDVDVPRDEEPDATPAVTIDCVSHGGPSGVVVEPDREPTDCGEGCTQVTLVDRLTQFCVQGDYLVYRAMKEPFTEGYNCGWIYLVDLRTMTTTTVVVPSIERCEADIIGEVSALAGIEDDAIYWTKLRPVAGTDRLVIDVCRWDMVDHTHEPIRLMELPKTTSGTRYWNVSEGREYQVTDFPGIEGDPVVDDGRIFFTMHDDADKVSVFMKTVESVKAAASEG